MQMVVCDFDCFKCPYVDCIAMDILTPEEREKSKSLDRIAKETDLDIKTIKRREQKRNWYYAHREQILERNRNTPLSEERREQKRKYYREHREEINQRNLANYYLHHEENKKKYREKARAKRELEKEGLLCGQKMNAV